MMRDLCQDWSSTFHLRSRVGGVLCPLFNQLLNCPEVNATGSAENFHPTCSYSIDLSLPCNDVSDTDV